MDLYKKNSELFRDIPLIIIGSAFSVPYGLPTMADLGKKIKNGLKNKYHNNS